MTAQKKSLVLIFDSNIFLLGIDFNIFKENIYTTPKIMEEIEINKYINKNRNILNKIRVGIERKKLFIKEPSIKFIKLVEQKSKITGDFSILSEADKGLIALAIELSTSHNTDVILYTNDYSMENLCSELKINFSPLFKKGIEKQITFEVFCPNCYEIYEAEYLYKECEICGTKLKRRPKRNIIN